MTATMKDFAKATDLAGQEVELIIPAKINDGVTRINIPNTAKFSFTDKNDHSGEKETKPVTPFLTFAGMTSSTVEYFASSPN